MQEIKKVVVIGPESTGKSTLCTLLAQHFNTIWCPEFAREFLLANGTNYTFETLEEIGKGQLALEEKMTSDVRRLMSDLKNEKSNISHLTSPLSPLLFIDTDMYVMKVWCEYVFGKCHQFILDEIAHRKYDLYLLCNTDIEWVKDELREYPDEKIRLELFHIYKDILINQNVPWIELKGDYNMRLQTAVKAVNQYI